MSGFYNADFVENITAVLLIVSFSLGKSQNGEVLQTDQLL